MGRNNYFINPDRNAVAILSGKGGTGKTSITVAMGYILAHCGFKTLLVDLDFFTNGSTFFLCKGYASNNGVSLSELFTQRIGLDGIQPLLVPSEFSMGNLFLLPSVKEAEKSNRQFTLSPDFEDIESFCSRMQAIVEHVRTKFHFDYILIDTRGGMDYTSAGAAFAAGYFILVSEADKPSWHMGELLLESIRGTKGQNELHTEQVGFIINKVDLPPKAIENYLQDRWKLQHLGTIPFNEKLVRFFQQSKSPIVGDVNNEFSRQVLSIVKNVFISETWNERNLDRISAIGSPGLIRRLVDLF